MDDFVHRLFGLGLAVPPLRRRCERAGGDAGKEGLLFLDAPKLGRGRSYSWGGLMGLLPRPTEGRLRYQLMPGLPRGSKWDRRLATDILRLAWCLHWTAGEVTYAELALDFELAVQQALAARPEHPLRMTMLPLQERATVLRRAVRALQSHMLLPATQTPRRKSLIPLGAGPAWGSQAVHTLRRGGKWPSNSNPWPHSVSHCGACNPWPHTVSHCGVCSVCFTPHV